MKFYPSNRGGGTEKVLAMLNGGHKKFRGSFYAAAWSLSHIVGGRENFLLFKRGGVNSFTLSWGGGGRKKFRTHDFLIL